jgi:hypothetical protein
MPLRGKCCALINAALNSNKARKRGNMKALLLSLFVSFVSWLPVKAYSENKVIVPPSDRVAGMPQSEWSRVWWQWAGAFDQDESPVADLTGERCHLKQSGPVWFLAGTYSSGRTIRTCRVPRGKYLFFPLINYVVMRPARREVTCEAVTATAKRETDNVGALTLEIDGVRAHNLVAHRQATAGCFDMGAMTDEKYRVFPSAANGYYIMLRPLSPGKHVLNFGGVFPDFVQAITYNLYVD